MFREKKFAEKNKNETRGCLHGQKQRKDQLRVVSPLLKQELEWA